MRFDDDLPVVAGPGDMYVDASANIIYVRVAHQWAKVDVMRNTEGENRDVVVDWLKAFSQSPVRE